MMYRCIIHIHMNVKLCYGTEFLCLNKDNVINVSCRNACITTDSWFNVISNFINTSINAVINNFAAILYLYNYRYSIVPDAFHPPQLYIEVQSSA